MQSRNDTFLLCDLVLFQRHAQAAAEKPQLMPLGACNADRSLLCLILANDNLS